MKGKQRPCESTYYELLLSDILVHWCPLVSDNACSIMSASHSEVAPNYSVSLKYTALAFTYTNSSFSFAQSVLNQGTPWSLICPIISLQVQVGQVRHRHIYFKMASLVQSWFGKLVIRPKKPHRLEMQKFNLKWCPCGLSNNRNGKGAYRDCEEFSGLF